MMKSLLYWLLAVCLVPGSVSALAADNVMTPAMSSMELSATPLLSRNLSEMDVSLATAADGSAGTQNSGYIYGGEAHGLGWLIDALIEPLYLSLLGVSMLILGTLKRRGDG